MGARRIGEWTKSVGRIDSRGRGREARREEEGRKGWRESTTNRCTSRGVRVVVVDKTGNSTSAGNGEGINVSYNRLGNIERRVNAGITLNFHREDAHVYLHM